MRSSGKERTFRRVTWIGLALSIALAALKFVFGWLGNSRALVADAVHSLSDGVSDLLLLIGHSWWSRPADPEHPYGHRQLETVATIVIGLLLAMVAIGIAASASEAFQGATDAARPGLLAAGTALIAIVVKELLYRWTRRVARRLESMPLLANAWHHRADALSSIPVLVAVTGAMLVPAWSFLDGVGALVVCVFLLHAAYRISWPSLMKLLGRGAGEAELAAIRRTAESHPNVREVHGVRTRYLGCTRFSVDMHVLVDSGLDVAEGHDVAEAVKTMILARHPHAADVLVHIEPYVTGARL